MHNSSANLDVILNNKKDFPPCCNWPPFYPRHGRVPEQLFTSKLGGQTPHPTTPDISTIVDQFLYFNIS